MRAWAFALSTALAGGVGAGLIPLMRGGQRPSLDALEGRPGRTDVESRAGRRTRTTLVVAQVALSVVLLVGAGLLVRTFQAIQSEDLGFRPDGTLTFSVYLMEEYPGLDQHVRFFDELREGLSSLPGVLAVGGASALPLSGGVLQVPVSRFERKVDVSPGTSVTEGASVLLADRIDGQEGEDWVLSELNAAQPGYFGAVGTPLLAGRGFDTSDGLDSPLRMIVDESVAKRFWSVGDAVGQRLWVLGAWREVVGVAGKTRLNAFREAARPLVYLPYAQVNSGRVSVVVHAESGPGALVPAIREAVAAIDPMVPIADIRTTEDMVREATARDRFAAVLISVFAVTAVLLVALGLYGVLSFSVGKRAREFAVRMAMGSGGVRVAAGVLHEGVGLAVTGVVLGVGIAVATAGVLEPVLYGVDPLDPITVGTAVAVVLAVAVLASWGPTVRAVSADPETILRSE